ncbi:MAG: hypothetical protein MZV49_09365 [Rhodopseudomonas palustris]|nr:hypothetical protein [Rhodopseudomonas palustris]
MLEERIQPPLASLRLRQAAVAMCVLIVLWFAGLHPFDAWRRQASGFAAGLACVLGIVAVGVTLVKITAITVAHRQQRLLERESVAIGMAFVPVSTSPLKARRPLWPVSTVDAFCETDSRLRVVNGSSSHLLQGGGGSAAAPRRPDREDSTTRSRENWHDRARGKPPHHSQERRIAQFPRLSAMTAPPGCARLIGRTALAGRGKWPNRSVAVDLELESALPTNQSTDWPCGSNGTFKCAATTAVVACSWSRYRLSAVLLSH